MGWTMEERAQEIMARCKEMTGTDPVAMALPLMAGEKIRLHGPEHHFLVAALAPHPKDSSGGLRLLWSVRRHSGGRSFFEPSFGQPLFGGRKLAHQWSFYRPVSGQYCPEQWPSVLQKDHLCYTGGGCSVFKQRGHCKFKGGATGGVPLFCPKQRAVLERAVPLLS